MQNPNVNIITLKVNNIGMSAQGASTILIPINTNINATPYFKLEKRSAIFANRKYNARNPSIANTLEVNITNTSLVIAKIAGILSNANMISLISIKTSTK